MLIISALWLACSGMTDAPYAARIEGRLYGVDMRTHTLIVRQYYPKREVCRIPFDDDTKFYYLGFVVPIDTVRKLSAGNQASHNDVIWIFYLKQRYVAVYETYRDTPLPYVRP